MIGNELIIVIGVSGVGKTTIGKLLSEKLQVPFYDADDFHPESNIQKMKSGMPLTDEDRMPWLMKLNEKLKESSKKESVVLACSALKESYRQVLAQNITDRVKWVVLNGSFETIQQRMQARNHFMPTDLLKSQFDTWQEPIKGIKISVELSTEEIIASIIEKLNMEEKAKIGLIGLGVMGKSLSRNIASRGISISVYNLSLIHI